MLSYITAFKGCIGCVQMAQLTELRLKLKIILEQGDPSQLVIQRKYIFGTMYVAMIVPSFVLIGVSQTQIISAFNEVDPFRINETF